jgi:HAD superfamily hydrolase (TIGR01509 family)
LIAAFIFDVDGTLAETEDQGHRRAFNAAFKRFDLDDYWSSAHYAQLLKVAGGKERMQYYWRSMGNPPAHDETLLDRLHRAKTQIYTELVEKGEVTLRLGVADVIRQARQQGIRLAVATTTARVNVETLIRSTLGTDALSWFEFIGCAENAANKKPAPDVYQLVLKQLRLRADQVIAFEDNRNGLLAANAAGIERVVVTPTFLNEDEDLSLAWQVLDDLTQFKFGSLGPE